MNVPTRTDIRGALRAFAKERTGEAANPQLISDQVAGVEELLARLKSSPSVLFYGSTGVGKTIQTLLAGGFIAAAKNRPVLVLAPNLNVRDQRWWIDLEHLHAAAHRHRSRPNAPAWATALNRIEPRLVDEFGMKSITGSRRALLLATTSKVSGTGRGSTSRTTAQRRTWLQKLDPCLVVIDEAHLRTGEGTATREALEAVLDGRRLLTLTATPVSHRHNGLEQIVTINGQGGWSKHVSAYQQEVHDTVRTWWQTFGDIDATRAASDRALRRRPAAADGFANHVVRQAPEAAKPTRPLRQDVDVDETWLRGYGLARILPALLAADERGEGAKATDGARPSDAYRRMLLSSSDAFWDSQVAKVLERRKKPVWQQVAVELRRLLGERVDDACGARLLMHPKVRWTAQRAATAATDRQVLIFVQYLASIPSLLAAIEHERDHRGLDIQAGSANDESAVGCFRCEGRGGVLIASPKHSQGLEFDKQHQRHEKPRLLIGHDLPWSAVALQQQQGRIRRAANGFPKVLIEAPVLDVPDDQRVWDTVMGRWNVSDMIDIQGGFAGAALGKDGPGEFPAELIEKLRLQ
jgi:hypothetical protein